MVERIDKNDHLESWRVQTTSETHKDREQSQQESGQDAFQPFQEQTDWMLLFDKSERWNKNIQVSKDEIDSILFRKINLKTDPSLLRVDIRLNGGQTISPAFLPISREKGLQLKNLNSGDLISKDSLMKDTILRIIVPANPQLFNYEEKIAENQKPVTDTKQTDIQEKNPFNKLIDLLGLRDNKTHKIKPEIAFIYVIIIALILIVFFIGGPILFHETTP